jgi:mannose-1-phosphate guanylyltransferase
MQALILAGGEGTRLRPLTETVPKPVVTLVDRPFITFMLEWLRGHGVGDVVLSCGFMAAGVRAVLGDGSTYGVRLRYVEEPEPLGTGGAVKLAEPLLEERFLVLNGDVLTDLDLTAQIAEHERSRARATLALVAVEDPSAYGLVRLERDGRVREFVEKPSPEQIDTDLVNAGAYVLDRSVLATLPAGERISLERDVFPTLVGAGLHGCVAAGYWLDIGTPERYLQGTYDILEGTVRTSVTRAYDAARRAIAPDAEVAGEVAGPTVVDARARIAQGARVSGCSVIGPDVRIEQGARVERSVVLDGARVGAHASLTRCVVGPGAEIGEHCEIAEGSVLGEGAVLAPGSRPPAGTRLSGNVSLPDGAMSA